MYTRREETLFENTVEVHDADIEPGIWETDEQVKESMLEERSIEVVSFKKVD